MTKYAFLLSEGIKNIWRHKLSALAAILSITICLLFVGGLLLVMQNTHYLLEYFRGKYKIEVFFEDSVSDSTALKISEKIQAMSDIRSTTLITREDAMSIFQRQYGEDVMDMLGYNPFPASCVVNVRADLEGQLDMNAIIERIQSIPGISELQYQGRLIQRIERVYHLARNIGFYISLGLILMTMLIVSNTIRLAVYSKRELIVILKTIGASNGFIRAPFVLEAVIQGLIAAALASLLIYFAIFFGGDILPASINITFDRDGPVFLILFAISIVIGLVGSYRSISKFL